MFSLGYVRGITQIVLRLFLVLGTLPLLSSKTLDRIVAVVQGRAILLSDVQSLRAQIQGSELLRGFYKIEGGITDQSVLNRLVEDQLIRARLKEINAEVSGDSVNREIDAIARQNRLTTPQLKAILKKQKVDFENYFDAMKGQIERRIIYNREISGSGSTLSDEELKAAYRKRAPTEFKLAMLIDSVSAGNKKLMDDIAAQVKSGKLSLEKLKEHPNYVDLGWMRAEDVVEHFKKGLAKAKVGDAVGPVRKDGRYQLLLVENSQKGGSDEHFEKVKESFRASVEDMESDKKFKIWFEKQKNQLEVTLNPL